MSTIQIEINTLHDLSLSLCSDSCDSKIRSTNDTQRAFIKHCQNINNVLSKLDVRHDCLDSIYNQINKVVTVMLEDVQANPEQNSLSLEIFITKYATFKQDLIKLRISQANLGNDLQHKEFSKQSLRFENLEGLYAEKLALQEGFIYPFKYPMLFKSRPKGGLLYGSSGTGKSYLINALGAELKDVRTMLFTPNVSNFKDKFEGETERKIIGMFMSITAILNKEMKKKNGYEYAVIFIDEIDSLFSKGRESDDAKGRIINTCLQCMDGINSDKRIIVFGATNFPQIIDAAISRRLTLKVFVDLPIWEVRKNLIRNLIEQYYGGKKCWEKFKNHSLPKLYVTEKDIDTFASLTSPKPGARAFPPKENKDDPDETNSKAYKEMGYTLDDITNALKSAFILSASRAISPVAHYDYDTTSGTYIYNPQIEEDQEDSETQTEADKAAYKTRLYHSDKIVSFDLRASDITDALKDAKTTVTKEDYDNILTWANNPD